MNRREGDGGGVLATVRRYREEEDYDTREGQMI